MMEIRHIIESWTLQFGIWFHYVQCKMYIYQIIIIIIWLWSMGISNYPTTEVIRFRDRNYEIELFMYYHFPCRAKTKWLYRFDLSHPNKCNICANNSMFSIFAIYYSILEVLVDMCWPTYMKCTKSGLSCVFVFIGLFVNLQWYLVAIHWIGTFFSWTYTKHEVSLPLLPSSSFHLWNNIFFEWFATENM